MADWQGWVVVGAYAAGQLVLFYLVLFKFAPWLRRKFETLMAKRVVHATGTVLRSDGNDTDCGAVANDPGSLAMTDDPEKVTCKRCLKIAEAAKKPGS